ncbi:response regulator [Kribbella sp. GL6]|uniref:response regulator n=1 Tax=Kribbella sp. GL6 TaxID=3419765 RepID=UPI003D04F787
MSTEPLRVLIVDDHPIVRRGLRAALAADPGIEVAGESATGADAVAQAAELGPDLVLMDLNLGPGMNGAEATRRLLELPRPPRVLILTTYDSDADILPAISAGATGYLLKDTDPDELLTAVRLAAAGETVLTPAIANRLVSRVRAPERALTAREIEILGMVAAGRSNQAIARASFITEATVKSHLVQVFAKLAVDSRTAAVAEARRRGIIP